MFHQNFHCNFPYIPGTFLKSTLIYLALTFFAISVWQFLSVLRNLILKFLAVYILWFFLHQWNFETLLLNILSQCFLLKWHLTFMCQCYTITRGFCYIFKFKHDYIYTNIVIGLLANVCDNRLTIYGTITQFCVIPPL